MPFEQFHMNNAHDYNSNFRKKSVVPKFHYEQKSFNILKSNTDLAETELEINIIRGIGYHVSNPKDVDTYVKVDFPYPAVNINK